jgi:hypothetical protein
VDVPPLVIAGMHRSGTSATARLLQLAGLDIGGRLMEPGLDNALGYYEDVDFFALNVDLIAAGVGDDPRFRPDWAFPERIDPAALAPLRPRAEALLAARSARGHAWGFKDPRASVLLDFYDELAPEARYLFVYRAPWEVLASLLHIHEHPLRGRADVAVRAWTSYNERLLAFRARHPDRTVLVHLDAVARRPDDVIELVRSHAPDRLGLLDAAGAREAFVDELLRRTAASSALAELLVADHPEAADAYARLEAAADLPGPRAQGGREPVRVEVEVLGGSVGAAAVLAGAPADGLADATRIARPTGGSSPAESADAGLARLPDDLVAVLFAGQLRPEALATAVASLRADPGLEVVLLATGGPSRAAVEHDPLSIAEAAVGVVVRRASWLRVRGFAAAAAPAGYEGWAFAVACLARGARIARIEGALHLPGASRGDGDVGRLVLEAHPALAARRAIDVATRAAEAEDRSLALEAERIRLASELARMRGTRAWRSAVLFWRLRDRLRGRNVS